MFNRFGLWTSYLILWLVFFSSLWISWDYLSGLPIVKITTLIICVASTIGLLLKKIRWVKLSAVFFLLLMVNLYQSQMITNPLLGLGFLFISLILIGLAIIFLENGKIDRRELEVWFVAVFLTTQSNIIITFWPFGFVERAVLNLTVFYIFYQAPGIITTQNRQSIIAHFVFTTLIVMVVIGVILWTYYPQLRIF